MSVPKTIENDILDKLERIGVYVEWVTVPRINAPITLSQTREDRAKEAAEREKELDNMQSRKDAAQLLKSGKDGLNISDDRALDAAELAAGDRTIIQVDGSGGDFTKGSVAGAVINGKNTDKK
jgi:hypothetical protein